MLDFLGALCFSLARLEGEEVSVVWLLSSSRGQSKEGSAFISFMVFCSQPGSYVRQVAWDSLPVLAIMGKTHVLRVCHSAFACWGSEDPPFDAVAIAASFHFV